jgi:hypothetical protein
MFSLNIVRRFTNDPVGTLVTLIKSTEFILLDLSEASRFTNVHSLFINSINKVNVDGLFLEFGVYTGGTINDIASIAADKPIFGFDSFQGLPEKWDNMPRGIFKIDYLPKVRNNVKLVKGMFEDTLKPFLHEHSEKVAFIHMDAALYSSTKYVLFTLAENNRLQRGTVIQFDELFNYNDWWDEGEYKALVDLVRQFDIRFKYLGYHSPFRRGHVSRAVSIILVKVAKAWHYGNRN